MCQKRGVSSFRQIKQESGQGRNGIAAYTIKKGKCEGLDEKKLIRMWAPVGGEKGGETVIKGKDASTSAMLYRADGGGGIVRIRVNINQSSGTVEGKGKKKRRNDPMG